MPCYQSTNLPGGVTTTGRTSYATEAECNEACKEGACCEGTTCTVKPQCQCQGAGKTFKGVGTTCSPNPCLTGACCGNNSLVCSDTTQEACEAAGGRYQGNGTNCSTANCCPSAYNPSWVGSCCVTSRQNGPFAFRCYSMTKSQCASAGGLFSCAQRCSGDATQSDDLGFYGSCNQAGIDAGLFNDGNPLP
jgi:hypothetical protein